MRQTPGTDFFERLSKVSGLRGPAMPRAPQTEEQAQCGQDGSGDGASDLVGTEPSMIANTDGIGQQGCSHESYPEYQQN
jgi:hypothetical protein